MVSGRRSMARLNIFLITHATSLRTVVKDQEKPFVEDSGILL